MTTILNRRHVLKAAAAGAVPQSFLSFSARASDVATPLIMILKDVPPELPEPVLRSFVTPFAGSGIPVAFSFKPERWAGADRDSTADIGQFFTRIATEYSGLAELMYNIQCVSEMRPYFQGRAAYEARRAMSTVFTAGVTGGDINDLIVTATDEIVAGRSYPRGMRVSGFRSVVLLGGETAPARFEFPEREFLSLSGGIVWNPLDAAQTVQPLIEESAARDPFVLICVNSEYLKGLNEAQAAQTGGQLSDVISNLTNSARITPILPRDYHLRANPDYRRAMFVSIKNDAPADADSQNALKTLAQTLESQTDIPVGIARIRGASEIPGPLTRSCFSQPDSGAEFPSGLWDQEPPQTNNEWHDCTLEFVGPEADPWQGDQPRAYLSTRADPVGISPTAMVSLGRVIKVEDVAGIRTLAERVGAHRDCMVVISSDVLEVRSRFNRLVEVLNEIARQHSGVFAGANDFLNTVTPFDPVYSRFRRRQNMATEAAPHPREPLSPREHYDLMQDARLAWTFVHGRHFGVSGLTPATVFAASERDFVHNRITMWEAGSLLLALVAGHELGLISTDGFIDRAAVIINKLPEVHIQGAVLPCSQISAMSGSPLTLRFNACDTGRLFSALNTIKRFPDLAGLVARKIASWDIGATVIDGRYQNIDERGFDEFYLSHCTHYASRAMKPFGYEFDSPYHLPDDLADSYVDRQMGVLYAAGNVGLLSSEPLLLEAMELGWTEETAGLASVLFTEQLYSARMTGELVCVSEVALNSAPWFTYQGLNIGSDTERWGIEFLSDNAQLRTEEFLRSVTMISSKAAYLWYALYPHPYSKALLEKVRASGRIEGLGFASGIFTETGLPTENYTDVNTNAIILQAIAHRLGPQPRPTYPR